MINLTMLWKVRDDWGVKCKNCNITMDDSSGSGRGIELTTGAENSTIINNSLTGQYYGLYFSGINYINVIDNNMSFNYYGISFSISSNNTLSVCCTSKALPMLTLQFSTTVIVRYISD